MLPAWLWLKIRKKWKPAYQKSLVTLRNKAADPDKRITFNKWYNKMRPGKIPVSSVIWQVISKYSIEIQEGEWHG